MPLRALLLTRRHVATPAATPVGRLSRPAAWRAWQQHLCSSSRGRGPPVAAALRHMFRNHTAGVAAPHPPHQRDLSSSTRAPPPPPPTPPPSDSPLDWSSLYAGAKLAYWSGLCYCPYDTLAHTLEAEGLQLVAYGRTAYTSWYVADGSVDFEPLLRRAAPQQHQPDHPQRHAHINQHNHHHRAAAQTSGSPATSNGAGSRHHGPEPSSGQTHQAAAAAAPGPSGAGTAAQDPLHANPAGVQPEALKLHLRTPQPALHLRGRQPHAQHEARGHQHHAPPQHGQHGQHGESWQQLQRDGSLAPAASPGPSAPGAPGGAGPHAGGTATHGSALPLSARAQPLAGRCRFVFLRGVQWSAPETNTLSLGTSLATFWPVPLTAPQGATAAPSAAAPAGSSATAGTHAPPRGAPSTPDPARAAPARQGAAPAALEPPHLVAHGGVAAMAQELVPELLPYISSAAAAGAGHVVLAGHSMGGSLATLLWAVALMGGTRSPAATSVYTFGSPPVLAHASGGGSARVLRALRAPPASATSYCLEHDPIPRAMLTADPYFSAARRALPGLGALLALRGALFGEGSVLSSGRFLFETVGDLLLLRWSGKGGCEVVPVSEAEAEQLLHMALDAVATAPLRSLQYWLDHHHSSYHHDLEVAALAAARRQARAQQQQQQQ